MIEKILRLRKGIENLGLNVFSEGYLEKSYFDLGKCIITTPNNNMGVIINNNIAYLELIQKQIITQDILKTLNKLYNMIEKFNS